jgi:2-dehydropantoate 2-reductase
MRIAVIGSGAIGGLVAGYLADKKEEIVLTGHPRQVRAISQNGLVIEGVRGRLSVNLSVKQRLEQAVDLVILATKTQDLEQAIAENLTHLKGTPILAVQNGIRAEDLIAGAVGQDNLVSSIVMFGATYLGPGRIMHNFEGDWILGKIEADSRAPLEEIAKTTSKIFPSPVSDDITAMKWLKLFLNANNCLPAILGKSMQESFKNIQICKISMQIWKEGLALVNKAGIRLESLPQFDSGRISGLIALPADKSAAIFSGIMLNLSKEPLYGSILQSIKRDRPSEIDYINGEFVKLAQSILEEAPLNQKLVEMVHSVEQNKRFLSEAELISQTKELIN